MFPLLQFSTKRTLPKYFDHFYASLIKSLSIKLVEYSISITHVYLGSHQNVGASPDCIVISAVELICLN